VKCSVRASVMTALVLVLCAVARNADAFDGKEHGMLAERALESACRAVPPSPEMEKAIAALQASPWTFGDVVVGVDWFQKSGSLSDPDVKDRSLQWRRWNYVMRGLAIHHNKKHFQKDAAAAWWENHKAALDFASRSDEERALLAEAVALHYLQDFFSVGHLATPRDGMHDAAAGDLHDYFNERGVCFRLASSNAMDAMVEHIAPSAEERAEYATAAGTDTRFHGDGHLHRLAAQRVFVLALSAFSIAEVFNATRATRIELPVLDLCARPRSALHHEIVRGNTLPSVKGPDGGVRLVVDRDAPPGPCSEDGVWLGRYLTEDDDDLRQEYYEMNGFIVRTDRSLGRRSTGARSLLEIRFFGLAEDPPGSVVNEKGEPTRPKMPWIQMQLGSAGLSYIWGHDYRAWGFLWDIEYWTPVDGLSWAARYGPRLYSYDDNNFVPRLDVGVKASFGWEVVGVTVGVDRSYEVDRHGSFGPAYFATVGLELTAPESFSKFAGPVGHAIRLLVPDVRRAGRRARTRDSAH
jgi:hypothetical protein